MTLNAEYHCLNLEEARDALYSNSGAPARRDVTGASGTEVGQEVNFSARWQIDMHTTAILRYGYVFAGDYLANTGTGDDAEFTYAWFIYKFEETLGGWRRAAGGATSVHHPCASCHVDQAR